MINLLTRLGLKKKRKDKGNTLTTPQQHVTIVGGGSWATALVKILSENGVYVHWWMRNQQTAKHIQKHHHNPDYLSGVKINRKRVTATNNITEALQKSEYVVLAVPAAYIQDALKDVKKENLQNKIVISAIKGIVPQYNILVTDFIHQYYNVPKENLAVIAGPCHAEEVAQEKQSYLTISSENKETAKTFAKLLENRYIKTSVNLDIYGVEYCAVMKNIIALACGICHGLNYGDNFQAVLVSNAMQEINRFVQKISPQERDMYASAYLGDLLVTAYSQFSRNRTFGNMIGRGYTVQSAQMEMNMVAEGYFAVKCIYEINQALGVNMPITKAVYKILYEKITASLEITILKDILR